MDLLEKIQNIENKVQNLVVIVDDLRKKNAALITENKELLTDISKKEDLADDLKVKLSKTQHALEVKSGGEPIDSIKLKGKIDQYIREIDKIIEWLNNA